MFFFFYIYEMKYNNMRVVDFKALAKERGLRGYSKLRKAELITFLQNNLQPTPAMRPRPRHPTRPPPPPPPSQSVGFRPDRPRQPELLRQLEERQRQPSSQEIGIFERQEMSKSRPQVKNKLNEWYNWLVSHIPKPIKNKASRVFKTFKDKIMGLCYRVKGKEPEEEQNREETEEQNEESFRPVELEQAFNRAYRSYRINGRSRIDIDTFFDRIRQSLIDLMNRELTDLNSMRVQTTTWIEFRIEYEDG